MPNTSRVTTVCLPPATPVDDPRHHRPPHLLTANTSVTPAPVNPLSHQPPPVHRQTSPRCQAHPPPADRCDCSTSTPWPLLAAPPTTTASPCGTASSPTRGPPQPFWTFPRPPYGPTRRSTPSTRAQTHYLAQLRIAAMRTYNLLPNRGHGSAHRPTWRLSKPGGDTYTHLGGLTAVTGPRDGHPHRSPPQPATDRLSDPLTYLGEAHTHLNSLTPGTPTRRPQHHLASPTPAASSTKEPPCLPPFSTLLDLLPPTRALNPPHHLRHLRAVCSSSRCSSCTAPSAR